MTYIEYGQISKAKESKDYDISLSYVIFMRSCLIYKRFPFENNNRERKRSIINLKWNEKKKRDFIKPLPLLEHLH